MDRLKGALMGVIVGDALGFTREGTPRNELRENPIVGMEYPDQQPFSDDSSMTLCAMESLMIHGKDLKRLADTFLMWYNNGYWTPDGMSTIGIGMTVGQALAKLQQTGTSDPTSAGLTDEMRNGNGSIMRILPDIIYHLQTSNSHGYEEMLDWVHKSSSITHAHPRSRMACGIYGIIITELYKNSDIEKSFAIARQQIMNYYHGNEEFAPEFDHFIRILNGDIEDLKSYEIESTGYVVHTLEAALWSLLNSDSFEESLLNAVNLGDDTDTIGSVTGGLAGMVYGFDAIPEDWISSILRNDEILDLVEQFVEHSQEK